MKPFLLITTCLALLSACERGGKGRTVIREPSDPLSPYPVQFLAEPNPKELREWNYILRYLERTHARTPLIIEERANQRERETRIIRIGQGGVEIDFGYSIELSPEDEATPPDWAMNLEEEDDASGLDGTIIGIELYTPGQVRHITRWAPEYMAKSRGLDGINRWVAMNKRLFAIDVRVPFGNPIKQR